MKIAFFSNFMNHHQLELCNKLYKMEDVEFIFIATTPLPIEQQKLGYDNLNNLDFVLKEYELKEKNTILEIIKSFDVMIVGSAPEMYAQLRIKTNKLLFRYSERIFKKGIIHAYSPKARYFLTKNHARYKRNNVYLLCASAYCYSDFLRVNAYKNKAYKWGYFPPLKIYSNIDDLLSNKKKNSILWVGRMIDWKHPEYCIELAKYLLSKQIDFHIKMIGTGDLYEEIIKNINYNNLENYIEVLGAVPSKDVRKHMEESQIFIFTSDRNEGWGAVLNEAMNSGCAVVANHLIGSVPFMINNKDNGLIYKNKDINNFFYNVEFLLKNEKIICSLGKNAYLTIAERWNYDVAAERLVSLSKKLMQNHKDDDTYFDGPCSLAKKLSDNWFKNK